MESLSLSLVIPSSASMASARAFLGIAFLDGARRQPRPTSAPLTAPFPSPALSRRDALLLCTAPLNLEAFTPASLARERRARKPIAVEDYTTTSEGLKYYDLVKGKGPTAERGANVRVHFDCVYRGVTAVSSRESKLLAGNRIIAQVGSPPGKERKRDLVDNANGLFSAQAAPKPPPVMYTITEGMRVGGKRTVIVPPELGYGEKGMNEIPPGATFDLNLELLEVIRPT